MAEGLKTKEGKAVKVAPASDTPPDEAWNEHMQEAARTADASEHDAPPRKDPEAPYGHKADGTPKKRAGRPATSGNAAAAPRIAKRGKAPSPPLDATKDYRPALTDFWSGIWSAACIGSQADAGAIYVATPALVTTWNAAAQQSKLGRSIVDNVTSKTALAMAFGATLMLGLQFAANHGRVAPESVAHLGIRSPAELAEINVAAMTAAAEEMLAAQRDAEMAEQAA